ncbi:MAG: hypothetical protein Q9183_004701 [Haloplaca sp. 2 TL-2023]
MSPRSIAESEILEGMPKPSSNSAEWISWPQRVTLNPNVRRQIENAHYDMAYPPSPPPPEPTARAKLAENRARVQGLEAQLEGLELVRKTPPAYLAKNANRQEEMLKRQEEVEECKRQTLAELHYLQTIAVPKLRDIVNMQEAHPKKSTEEIMDHYEEESQWNLLMPAKQRVKGSTLEEEMAPTNIPESVFTNSYNFAQDRFCESTGGDPTRFINKMLREHLQD